MSELTHQDYCVLAAEWMRRPESKGGPGCLVSMSECQAADFGETPDAIGFRSTAYDQYSVLCEAKTSRADFLSDANKAHRIDPAKGMGSFRYFIAPEGLIALDELPPKWGLIDVRKGRMKVKAGHVLVQRDRNANRDFTPWVHECNQTRELSLIVKMLARVGDVDKYQRVLKAARNDFARAATSGTEYRQRAEHAERMMFLLKCRLEEAGHSLPDEYYVRP